MTVLADALLAAADNGRRIERLFIGGNPLGAEGAVPLTAVVAAGAIDELYVSAAQLGDTGALLLADALERAPYGRLVRLSVASNGIGPRAAARLVTAATAAGVALLDLGRVRAAAVLGAADNRVDLPAAAAIAEALVGAEHRLSHLVLSHTGMRSREPTGSSTRHPARSPPPASSSARASPPASNAAWRPSPPTSPTGARPRRGRRPQRAPHGAAGEGEHGVSDAPDR